MDRFYWINGEPMVYDLDLAWALEYSRAANIRKVVAGLIEGGQIGPDGVFSAAEKTTEKGGRPGTAYYLGEKAALKVVTKSETAQADAITDSVIEVFIQTRNGQLPAQQPEEPAEDSPNTPRGDYIIHGHTESPAGGQERGERRLVRLLARLAAGSTSDRLRVDCITDEYAVEVDFGDGWAEAIGQALYYAERTGRWPGIVLGGMNLG